MIDEARQATAHAILRRAILQGCRPVWDGPRLADLIGPKLAMIEFTEAMRRLFPEVPTEPEAPPSVAPPPPDPVVEAARQDMKRRRQQMETWRRGQRSRH